MNSYELLRVREKMPIFAPSIYVRMQSETNILFIGIIAMLVIIISVLLWRNLRSQRELREKNDAIIREIQENVKLREELRRRIPHAAVF